ncbi:MAG: winged helix-turn-helix domain-containing protein [Myxococcales bacterium]|nr:winged helix-turn-helix domain-containing protein [Myxococcales bacterium]
MRAAASGLVTLSGGVVDLERRVVERGERAHTLSVLEVSFLGTLLEAEGRPVPRDVLLREVWGYRSTSRSRSVDHAVKRLRRKLERDPRRPEHLLTVHQVGYRLAVESESAEPGFVGRESELQALSDMLRDPGLVTLIGPGGMGKSSVARQIVRRLGGRWSDRVEWVDLQGQRSLQTALCSVAEAIGMTVRRDVAVEAIGQCLADRGVALLVLDAVEGVARPLGAAVAAWRRCAPKLRILVTSRVRLHARGEQLLELGPLAEDDAVALLRSRARAVRLDLEASQQTWVALAARLDGMPLALELAAGRANVLSPEQLLAEVQRRSGLLSSPTRTLQSVLDASWELASADEQAALVQLCLFEGGFQVQHAAAVLGQDAPAAIRCIQALRDQSWLRAWTSPGAPELRLGMYESVRDYLLTKPPAGEAVQLRHAEVFAALGAPSVLRRARQARTPAALARYGAEHANLRVAFETAMALGRHDLAVRLWAALHKWLHHRGPFATSIALAERLLEGDLPSADEALVRRSAADLHRRLGHMERAEAWARRGMACADDGGSARLGAACREVVASLLLRQGKGAAAEALLHEAETLLAVEPCPVVAASVWSARGALARDRGDLVASSQRYEQALQLALDCGDTVLQAAIHNALATVARALGDQALAAVQYARGIEVTEALDGCTAVPRMNLANLHADCDRFEEAEEGYRAALADATTQGNSALQASILTNLATVYLSQGDYAQALELLVRALPLHRQRRSRRHEVATLLILGEVALRQRIAATAGGRFHEARRVAEAAGLQRHWGLAELGMARAALLRGLSGEAEDWLQSAEPRLRAVDHRRGLAQLQCVRGLLAQQRGEAARAREHAASASRLAPQDRPGRGSTLAWLLARLDRER